MLQRNAFGGVKCRFNSWVGFPSLIFLCLTGFNAQAVACNLFDLQSVSAQVVSAQLAARQSYLRTGFSRENRSRPIPNKVPFRDTYVAIHEFLKDRMLVFDRLQQLEVELILASAREWGPKELILEQMMNAEEAHHGFKKVVDLEARGYEVAEWKAMLRAGSLFRDWAFQDKDRQGSAHGMLTHRLQWFLVLRELREFPEDFQTNGVTPQGVDLFKAIGKNATTIKLWDILFDSFENDFTNPATMRGQNHHLWPGIGEWE